MSESNRADELQKAAESINSDRQRMIVLYRSIQAISETVPNFNNPEIDKTANTILEGLKLMEQWLAAACQKHFNQK